MMLVVVVEVLIRYTYVRHLNIAYDISWICFVMFAFIGAGYALAQDVHIKVDIFYNMLKRRGKIIVNAIGYPVFFFLPMGSLVYAMSILVRDAWVHNISGFWTPLDYPLWPLRLAVLIGVTLMTLQGCVKLAEFIREPKEGERL